MNTLLHSMPCLLHQKSPYCPINSYIVHGKIVNVPIISNILANFFYINSYIFAIGWCEAWNQVWGSYRWVYRSNMDGRSTVGGCRENGQIALDQLEARIWWKTTGAWWNASHIWQSVAYLGEFTISIPKQYDEWLWRWWAETYQPARGKHFVWIYYSVMYMHGG